MSVLAKLRSQVAALALFAMALQLVAAFGHVHSIPGADHVAPIGASIPTPADHDNDGAPDTACAICSVIHLAGTLDLPAAATLQPPQASRLVWSPASTTQATATSSAGFNARAPPQA